MSVERLGWLGVRTDHFEQMVSLYRDLLGLDAFPVVPTKSPNVDNGAARTHGGPPGSNGAKPLPATSGHRPPEP
jgi:hypothetical protein